MKMTIGIKLCIGFVTLLLMITIIGWMGISNMGKVNLIFEDMAMDEFPSMQQALTVQSLVNENYSLLLEHISSTDVSEMEKIEGEFDENSHNISALLAQYEKNISDPDEQEVFEDLGTKREHFLTLKKEIMVYSKQGKKQQVIQLMDELHAAILGFKESNEQLVDFNRDSVQEKETVVRQVYYSGIRNNLILLVVAILIGGATAFYLTRLISSSLKQVSLAMKRVANGDLTVEEIKVKSKDEIGTVVLSLNQMVKDLATTIGSVQDSSTQVAAQSEELSASAEQSTQAAETIAQISLESAKGAERQLQTVTDVTSSIEEMSLGIQQIARESEEMLAIAENASTLVKKGANTVQVVTSQMKEIHQSVDETTHIIMSLGERSNEIGRATDLITDLSNQTNLLALNAAIEAARAGEQGKGFAVVAAEVRKLAEESKRSAEQIALIVESIQHETNRSILSMNEGNNKVKQGLTYTEEVNGTFTQIKDTVSGVSKKVEGVSAAIEQISAVSNELVLSVEQVQQVAVNAQKSGQKSSASTEEQLAAMEEISSSAQHLSHLAENLQGVVGRFTFISK